MIINMNRTVAYRCARCGEIAFADISLFDLCSNGGVAIRCSCGETALKLTYNGRNGFLMQLPCIFCDDVHTFSFTFKDIAYQKCKEFTCPDFGYEIGIAFLGRSSEVADHIAENETYIRELADEMNVERAGKNTVYLLKAIDRIRVFAGNGAICCECGSMYIDMDVSATAVYLVCEKCGNVLPITLENIKSGAFSRMDKLVIRRHGNHAQ